MVRTCVVWGCTNLADSVATNRQFFDIPKVIHHQGEESEKLLLERRNLTRINRGGFDPDPNKRHYKVCSYHFITGNKANLYDSTNPDWAPSQKMGPELTNSCQAPDLHSSKKRYQRATARQEKVKKIKAAEALLDLQKDTTQSAHVTAVDTKDTSECDAQVNEEPEDNTPTDGELLEMMPMEVQRLTSENMELKDKIKETVLSPETLDDDKSKHYTGLDYETLMATFRFLEPNIPGRMNSSLTQLQKWKPQGR